MYQLFTFKFTCIINTFSELQVQGAFLTGSNSPSYHFSTALNPNTVTEGLNLNFLLLFFPNWENSPHSVKNMQFPHTQRCHSHQPWIPPTRRRNTDCLALKSSKRPRRRNTRNINKGAVKSYNDSLGPRSRSNMQDPRTRGQHAVTALSDSSLCSPLLPPYARSYTRRWQNWEQHARSSRR